MNDEQQIREVMQYFHCDRDMAQRIIKASVMNGGEEHIKNLCHNDWRKK